MAHRGLVKQDGTAACPKGCSLVVGGGAEPDTDTCEGSAAERAAECVQAVPQFSSPGHSEAGCFAYDARAALVTLASRLWFSPPLDPT